MSGQTVIGLDVGGAHLKLARLGRAATLEAARIAPCALWRGLGELDAAFAELAGDLPGDAQIAVTMTGELVDLWPDRPSGVAALSQALADRLGPNTSFYAGAQGFLDAADATRSWEAVASANWRATAEALAITREPGLLVDIGSTTTDLIPISGGAVTALGTTDAERLANEELVYLGVARTPVMAIALRLPWRGKWTAPMAEHFATSADIFRLTGELPDGADLHPAADGGEKTFDGSARRLLRMVGADLSSETRDDARDLAAWLGGAIFRRIDDAASLVLSRADAPDKPTVWGAGVGRFLARRLAESRGLLYRDVGAAWCADRRLAGAAADCAPAVAVARLLQAKLSGRPARPRAVPSPLF